MHFLFGAAGLAALITFAFGKDVARVLAIILLVGGTIAALWLGYLIVTEQL
jgi:uncharacterized membrane protein